MRRMKKQNNGQNTLESRTLKNKIREIIAISIFTGAAAVAAIILADLIVFPLTHFAVVNVDIFNLLFKNLLLIILLTLLGFSLVGRYRKLSDEGLNLEYIILYFLKRPFHYGALFISFILISSIMVTILYILFSMNYYYLYKISGGL